MRSACEPGSSSLHRVSHPLKHYQAESSEGWSFLLFKGPSQGRRGATPRAGVSSESQVLAEQRQRRKSVEAAGKLGPGASPSSLSGAKLLRSSSGQRHLLSPGSQASHGESPPPSVASLPFQPPTLLCPAQGCSSAPSHHKAGPTALSGGSHCPRGHAPVLSVTKNTPAGGDPPPMLPTHWLYEEQRRQVRPPCATAARSEPPPSRVT